MTFWFVAPVVVLAALGVLVVRKAVHAALLLAVVMIGLAVLYAALEAPFLFAVQIIVYTGAILMLFLFVVMLVGVDASDSTIDALKGQKWWGLALGLGLAALLIGSIAGTVFPPAPPIAQMNAEGNVTGLAYLIFGRYLGVFQLVAALLITATLAAMVLAHRERLLPKPAQREWSQKRVRDNRHVAGLPAPGVYARHNAVDTPALLPDGTPSELSISRVLASRQQLQRPDEYTHPDEEIAREIEEGSHR